MDYQTFKRWVTGKEHWKEETANQKDKVLVGSSEFYN